VDRTAARSAEPSRYCNSGDSSATRVSLTLATGLCAHLLLLEPMFIWGSHTESHSAYSLLNRAQKNCKENCTESLQIRRDAGAEQLSTTSAKTSKQPHQHFKECREEASLRLVMDVPMDVLN
jgi:hypothetical protein